MIRGIKVEIKANIDDDSYSETDLVKTITDNIQWAINEFFDMEVFKLIVSVNKDWSEEDDN